MQQATKCNKCSKRQVKFVLTFVLHQTGAKLSIHFCCLGTFLTRVAANQNQKGRGREERGVEERGEGSECLFTKLTNSVVAVEAAAVSFI